MPVISKTEIGTVVRIDGQASRRPPGGSDQPLQVGDEVRLGDEILTTQNGIVEINFGDSKVVVTEPDALPTDLPPLIPPGFDPQVGIAGGGGSLTPGLRVDRIAEDLTPAAALPLGNIAGEVNGPVADTVTAGSAAPAPVPPPLAPTLTVDAPDGTVDTTPTLTGTSNVASGTLVTLVVTDAQDNVQMLTAPVQADGSYSVDVPLPLAIGPYTVQASVTAANGLSASASDPGSVVAAAEAPTIALDPVAGDDVLSDAEAAGDVTLSGRVGGGAQPGDTVLLTVGGQTFSATVADDLSFAVSVPGALLAADAGRVVGATITIDDGLGGSNSAQADRAYGLNGSPTAVDDAVQVGEDTPSVSGDLTPGTPGQDRDPEGDPLTVTGIGVGDAPPEGG
ncbi:MAG: Ig-like domain-containing protein, partial [Rubrivivax sp.]|nr:Ig-like domain-containing protein [Rubrivivax sp.]